MRRTLTLLALATCTAAAGTAVALAATPEPGADYIGHTSQGKGMAIQLRVADDARSILKLTAEWKAPKCTVGRNGAVGVSTFRRVTIYGSRFSKSIRHVTSLPAIPGKFRGGSQVEHVRVIGSFPSVARATGVLRVKVDVRNRSRVVISHCTTTRQITWTAPKINQPPTSA